MKLFLSRIKPGFSAFLHHLLDTFCFSVLLMLIHVFLEPKHRPGGAEKLPSFIVAKKNPPQILKPLENAHDGAVRLIFLWQLSTRSWLLLEAPKMEFHEANKSEMFAAAAQMLKSEVVFLKLHFHALISAH